VIYQPISVVTEDLSASEPPLLKQEGQTRAIVFDRERRGGRTQRIDRKAFGDDDM